MTIKTNVPKPDFFYKLEKFGKLNLFIKEDKELEILITDGFSIQATNTLDCLEVCREIAKDYPYIKKWITEENKFHLILTKQEEK
ncbi:hypothetical protein [Flavobacterium sp.]|uniref:hypothetical protein n=1 Tax=Flavobacterium sp. TaxID=239 RepID=UPI002614E3D1|nr:hypothetical protein [Flavobacterium sp.]